ncbi:MAG: hypothetical protein ACJA13_000342 [Paraglaciecola sp.]|jgi:hypothetical protein
MPVRPGFSLQTHYCQALYPLNLLFHATRVAHTKELFYTPPKFRLNRFLPELLFMQDHGHFTIWLEYNVLFFTASGTWNTDTTQRFCNEFKRQARQFEGQKWVAMANLTDWQLNTPETEPLLRELAIWGIQYGLQVVIRIYPPNPVKIFQLNNISQKLPSGYQQMHFVIEQDAFTWLHNQGYQTKSSSFSRRITSDKLARQTLN